MSVHQVFKGSISGDALLLLNYSFAVKLTNLLQKSSQEEIVYLNVL